MAGTHGDLFREIGKLVLAAHAGQSIDLDKKSRELAHRYWKLGVPPETIARAIARSLGAVSMSMAIVRPPGGPAVAEPAQTVTRPADDAAISSVAEADDAVRSPAALFPSGVRLAVLS
jgi:hypothetical protein